MTQEKADAAELEVTLALDRPVDQYCLFGLLPILFGFVERASGRPD